MFSLAFTPDGMSHDDGGSADPFADMLELPIEPDVGVQIVAPRWQQDTIATFSESVPFTIVGPAHVLALLEREAAGAPLDGFISPPNKITIKGERARKAGIPMDAAFYSFAYPLEILAGKYRQLVDEERQSAPWLFFLLLGGFCYYDADRKLIQTNAFVMTTAERKLTLAGPFHPSATAVGALRSASRLRPLTLAPLRAQGFERFAWVNPGEKVGGAELLADGAELPPNNGAFVYELASGDAVVYPVINKALYGVEKDVAEGATIHTALGRLSRSGEHRRGQIDSAAEKWRARADARARTAHRRRNAETLRTAAAMRRSIGEPYENLSAWAGFIPLVVQQQIAQIADQAEDAAAAAAAPKPPPTEILAAAIFADASGFTALTERLSRLPDGAERMCSIMNSFLGHAIRIVHAHGGQVLKFAGDALSAMFEVREDRTMAEAVESAARCCYRMHEQLHGFVAWSPGDGDGVEGIGSEPSVLRQKSTDVITLSLHIGLGCGSLALMHLGGHQSRREYVAAGTAISEAARAEPYGASGETVASERAWALLSGSGVCAAQLVDAPGADEGGGLWKLGTALLCDDGEGARSRSPTDQNVRTAKLRAAQTPLLRNYVPRAVTLRLDEGVVSGAASSMAGDASLSEIREVTVMFINLKGLRLGDVCDGSAEGRAALEAAQATMLCVQEEVHYMEGEVNKMLVDDKGTVLLCVFGLPPRSHPDDPLRAVRTALLLAELLDGSLDGFDDGEVTRPVACIGVGSGRVFCGTVGTIDRREFTTMGDAVNMAARMMQQASKAGAASRVLCDQATVSHTRKQIHYNPLPPVRLKGKAGTIPLYAPVAELDDSSDPHSLISRMGRDAEFRQLRGMVSDLLVYQGGAGNLMLVGSQGSGKRALVAALAEFGASAHMYVLKSELRHHALAVREQHRSQSMLKFQQAHGRSTASIRLSHDDRSTHGSSRLSLEEPSERSEHSSHRKRSVRPADDTARGSEAEPLSTPVSSGAAALAVQFGSSLRKRVQRHEVRNMLPVTSDICVQMLKLGTIVLGVRPAELVRDALVASEANGGRELVKHGWLLTELLDDTDASSLLPPKPSAVSPPIAEDATSAVSPTGAEELTLEQKGTLLLQMILALLRRLALAPSAPRIMLLLHLDAGSAGDTHAAVPIWTWRLARMISEAISSDPLPVMLCVVTSAVSAMHHGLDDDDAVGAAGEHFERAHVLTEIKSAAVRTDSFLKLEPLTQLAQHSYALQVLRAKYAYSGTLDGVPLELLEFVVSRSGGKPVFIEQMLDVLDQQELLNFVYAPPPAARCCLHLSPLAPLTFDYIVPSARVMRVRVAATMQTVSWTLVQRSSRRYPSRHSTRCQRLTTSAARCSSSLRVSIPHSRQRCASPRQWTPSPRRC